MKLSNDKLILVIGGTGAQGQAVVKVLVEPSSDGAPSPYTVRILTRNPDLPKVKAEFNHPNVLSFYFVPAQTAPIGRPELFRLVFWRLCAWVLSIPHEIHCCMHCLLLGFIVEPGYNFPSGILRVSCEGELVFFRYRDICPVTV